MTPALDGLLVAETGDRIAAGVCGSLLAQLGATVVLVEPEAGSGKARHRALFAAGKLSIAAEPALVARLAARADVVIASSDAGGAPIERGPAQIVCDVTAFGATGPLAGRAAGETELQALSGMMHTTGLPDGPPVPAPLPLVETMTGLYAAAAVLAALRVRRRSGAGQAIDMSLYDCAFAAMTSFLPFVLEDPEADVGRIGNRHALAAPWNVYRARDGWVLLCAGSDEQWRRLASVMGRSELASEPGFALIADRVARSEAVDAVVQAWVGGLAVDDCVARLGEAAIACGPVAPIDGRPVEANLDHRGMVRRLVDPVSGREITVPASPLRMSATPGRTPDRIPRPDEDRGTVERLLAPPLRRAGEVGKGALPLAGVRVIEIGHYTTAPLSARHLAQLGADVIKIEPPEGEATRNWRPLAGGQSVFFGYTNADKRSLAVDIRSEAGAEALRRLVARADVLIENLKPGALARRGFSAEALARLNPRLIYCAVSGFGADSLYAGRPAFDTVVQAMSGVMDAIRSDDGSPLKAGISSADLMGAAAAVVAVIAALDARERTGEGQYIDLSMQDVSAWATQTLWNGAEPAKPTLVDCADGWVAADDIEEPCHTTPSSPAYRGGGADAAGVGGGGAGPNAPIPPLRGVLPPRAGEEGEITRSHRLEISFDGTRAELVDRLRARGIAAAPVMTVREILDFPQTEARRLWFRAGDFPLLASPLGLLGTPPVVARPMAALGRDNDSILREIGLEGT